MMMCAIAFVFLLVFGTSQAIDVGLDQCKMSLTCGESSDIISQEGKVGVQGPPGKRGAEGPKGDKGNQGEVGPTGSCECQDVENLKREIRYLQNESRKPGGWIVFQRRVDGSLDFYRNWQEYVDGFGDPNHEFWLGLESLHQMTKDGEYAIKIQLQDRDGKWGEANYDTFIIGDATSNYKLTATEYTGNIGDSLISGYQFSTKDKDNDSWPKNCASNFHGAWWYAACHISHLNGDYSVKDGPSGVYWKSWNNNSVGLKTTLMMLKRKNKE